ALDGLGTPQGTPSEEAARLRSLAAIGYLRGEYDQARARLEEFSEKFGGSGIGEIDEVDNRFSREFRRLLEQAEAESGRG
ncbi:hypothetical protein ACFQ07_01590, partial [Actinomadura adrarensis]